MTVERVVNAESEKIKQEQGRPLLEGLGESHPTKWSTNQKLEITEVHWGVTINTGNYSNVRLSATANVWADYDPVTTLHHLQEWVAEEAPVSDLDLRHLSGQRAEFNEEMDKLEDQMNHVRRRWQICKDFCKAVGLEIPQRYAEDLPF